MWDYHTYTPQTIFYQPWRALYLSYSISRHIFSVCDDGHLKVPSLDASKEVKLKIITAVLLASQTVALRDLYLAIEMAS